MLDINTTWMIPDSECWIQVGEEDAQTQTMFVKAKIKQKPSLSNINKNNVQQCFADIKDVEDNRYANITKVKINSVYQVNQEVPQGYNDMVEMDHLNQAEILINLQRRYDQDLIFTFIGPTLVVMNPYKLIPKHFSNETRNIFSQQAKHQGYIDYKKNDPHTYAVAAQSYCKLFEQNKNQAIVISGESGAGKTENAKICMCFLTGLSGQDAERRPSIQNSTSPANKNKNNIEDRILGCNPILEAFGNAKTVRNDNSSRFGKFVSIQVGKKSRKIKGATIQNYLLEKSRVTTPGPGERGYHIFYHLLYCGQNQLLENLQLVGQYSKPQNLNYLKVSNCYEVSTINDNALFKEVVEAFHTMGINQEEQDTIFRIISSILLLGNVQFDQSTLTDTQPCTVKDEKLLKTISDLLKLDFSSLLRTINTVTRKIGSSVIYSPKKIDEVISSRDSIARNMYDRMFSWIVTRLNNSINIKGENGKENENEAQLCIGLLDIFGFEVFEENSFEQFCINYTNEKLQQLYIQYVFKSEEQEFIIEGLEKYINQLGYKDNQNIIEVLDNHPIGIFQLIDESSALAQSDDKKLYESIYRINNGKPEVKFVNKGNKKIFQIVHTAKPVDYSIEGFRDKNKAEISQELQLTIAQSDDPIVSSIFLGIQDIKTSKNDKIAAINQQQYQTKSTKENKFLGSKFRAQMKQLMDELIQSDCHFIRCIKPNETKRANNLIQGYVLIQIKYLGVLQAILARKEGFPYRKDFKVLFQQFSGMIEKYRTLSLQKIESQNLDLKNISQDILQELFKNNKDVLKHVLVGKTKIFAKDDFGKILDEMLFKWYEQKKSLIFKIIKQFQVYQFKKNLKANMKILMKAIKTFQKISAVFKMKCQRKRFLQVKKSTALIYSLMCKNFKKQFIKQWNIKTKQIIVAQKQKEREQAELLAKQKLEVKQQQNEMNKDEIDQQIDQNSILCNTIDRKDNYNTNLSQEYATISNYNTFNAVNNNQNNIEMKQNYKDLQENYLSSKGEADMNEKMKQEFEQIQQKNKEILQDAQLEDGLPQKIKLKSKVESFLNLDNPNMIRPGPNEKSKDCLIDFNECNQEMIQKIEQSNYFEIISTIVVIRKYNSTDQNPLQKMLSYQKRQLKKPLTSIDKHYEPIATKAFSYMLKYAGDKPCEEIHPRIIAWKLAQLILDQDVQEVTDEIFLQVIKQLTNNSEENIEQYFKIAALIASCVVLSCRIVFPSMNFFLEQARHYEKSGKEKLMEWCKFILSRIGNSYNFDENMQFPCYIFKREEMPLKEEFIALENMFSIQIPIHFYGDRQKYFKVESYTKICNMVSQIGLDLEILYDKNSYGLVEYITVDAVTKVQILDFGMRILDWKAKRYRDRQQYLQKNPGKTFEIKLYYQCIIFHSPKSQNIDTNLMTYLTYVNEYLHGLYFFDFNTNKDQIQNKLIDYPKEITEIDFIVEMSAAKVLADYKIYKKENIILQNCIPNSKIIFIRHEVWKVKIEDQICKLQQIIKTQRQARTYFLNRMKEYQGKYYFSQKFFCKFSQHPNFLEQKEAICLTKLGYVYIIEQQTYKQLLEISYRDIKDFSINFYSQSLVLYTEQNIYQIFSQYALNIYYNIKSYCQTLEELDNDNIQEDRNCFQTNENLLNNSNEKTVYDSKNSNQDQKSDNSQVPINMIDKVNDDTIVIEMQQYSSNDCKKQQSQKTQKNVRNGNLITPVKNQSTYQNEPQIPNYSANINRGSEEYFDNSPNSQYSSGQNKLINNIQKNDQKLFQESKINLNKQLQEAQNDTSNIDQTNRSCNLYENLL
ncbi:myosin head protein (macronuclear) [Tetrahymena thermophila SB210]|uniref:Myosin head protein n=2 Tax=Tetrahymena thermophila TaxID=5911 RepID=Q23KD0_TETTS|nr:myosin head protein [Tetrahymena thermophila SB210]EAR96913.2 myosin head protein [Tetrahymena thermophila SB210]BAE16270.1 myosin 4 [Tetrahymena thermophila]|eukprot:XP_001017158.2 myosin head protein [Tetrahymena thermophila SB210]